MSSSNKPVLPAPSKVAKDGTSSSSDTLPGGGVRLDAGEYTPPPSQLPQNYRKIMPTATQIVNTTAGSHVNDTNGLSSSSDSSTDGESYEDSGDESDDEATNSESGDEDSHEEESTNTPVGEHDSHLASDEEDSSDDSDAADPDDVFSPAKSSNLEHMTEFTRRLSVSATRARTGGVLPTSVNDARTNIKPAFPFKEENETISIRATPTLSPAKTIGERRLARRAVTFGENVALSQRTQRTIEPLNLKLAQPGVFLRHQTSDVDAQELYPPTACVFVANLPQPEDDMSLEAAVTRAFCVYGTVFVKIRRDPNDMPFAFCQYTKDEDAVKAMVDGKGTMILGRPCRTEMVKANRSFLIWKRNRTNITVEEAREIMEQYGKLAKCERLDEQARLKMKLPQAILAEFARFDPAREASTIARQNLGYEVEALDSKMRAHVSRTTENQAFLKQYEADRRSIYVAGLPADVDEDEVVRYFRTVGDVVGVEIIRRRSMDNTMGRVFAFVEFTRIDTPDIAIAKLDNTKLRDKEAATLKVQRKEVRSQRTPKRAQSMNQLDTRFDRNRLSSPRSSGNLIANETPPRVSRGATFAQPPTTPGDEIERLRPMGAREGTEPVSPADFGPHGYYGFGHAYSPVGYVGHQINLNPAMYGTSIPTTPPAFGHGISAVHFNGPLWPAQGGYPHPGEHTGGMPYGYLPMYGTSPTHGEAPVFESPVHHLSGMGHPGVGHPAIGHQGSGFGYPIGNPGYSSSGFDRPSASFGHLTGGVGHNPSGGGYPANRQFDNGPGHPPRHGGPGKDAEGPEQAQ